MKEELLNELDTLRTYIVLSNMDFKRREQLLNNITNIIYMINTDNYKQAKMAINKLKNTIVVSKEEYQNQYKRL